MDLTTALIIIGIILFGFISLTVLIMTYYYTVFRFKVRHFYQLSADPQFHEGKTYRARKLKVGKGKGGLYELWVPKIKQYVSYYGKKMGKNLFYYAEGPDGYLYNITLGDLDTAKGVLDVEPINRDVRAFHLNVSKATEEDYNKPKNWPIILQSIAFLFALLILVGGGYFIIDKSQEGLTQTTANLEASKDLTNINKELIVEQRKFMETWSGGGSGLIKVGGGG